MDNTKLGINFLDLVNGTNYRIEDIPIKIIEGSFTTIAGPK